MAKRNPAEEAGKWVEKTRPARKALHQREQENRARAMPPGYSVVDPVGHQPFQRKKK